MKPQAQRLHIHGGRLVDPATGTDRLADIYLADGKILAWDKPPADFSPQRTLDAQGLVVCPGLVDLDAHLRAPSSEYKATLESELAAAVASGITSLACPPDTKPVLDEPGLVAMIRDRSHLLNLSKVYPIGALTLGLRGERLTEMAELSDAGCVAFGQAQRSIADTQVLLRAMLYAATFDLPVWFSPLDHSLGYQGLAHQGATALGLGLTGVPTIAELLEVQRLMQLAEESGVQLHLNHLTSAKAVAAVKAAREAGVYASCDVSITHLYLCDEDLRDFDTLCKLEPVLRTREDRESLRRGLAQGLIQAVCSQHRPVDDDAKRLPFAEAEAGASSLEFLLPLTLQWGLSQNLNLAQTLAPITSQPAQILGIHAGTLAPGAPADLCLFDPQESYQQTENTLFSQGKNSPFFNTPLTGKVKYCLIDGQIIFPFS